MTFQIDAVPARTHDQLVIRSLKSLAVPALVAVLSTACDPGPVEWRGEAVQIALAPAGDETEAPVDARLVLQPDGSAELEAIAASATSPVAADSTACESSLRIAALSPTELYGVWWSRREGGRAALVAARSDDGGATWLPPVAVDTTDRGTVACGRPDPAIAADARSGYVHVTYFLHGPNGPGVFFSHSMERGALFHAPVPIMYGERPAETAVASVDSVVVVAFEDPNSKRSRVSLAMSRTWGHIFARERPEASNGETLAARPLIALRDSVIAVGWHGVDRSIVARIGEIK
jgi:hypothetical protein